MKIVVGVDGSETAGRAAVAAARLAAGMGEGLCVLTAYRARAEEAEARAVVERERDRLQAEFPGLEVETKAVEGKPAAVLVEVAEADGADVVVVGNHRVQGLARVLGSVAAEVADHATCDVFIVHTHP